MITGPIDAGFIAKRAEAYASKIHEKCNGLGKFVGLINGTVLGVVRPKYHVHQHVVFNVHIVNTRGIDLPDGLMLHVARPSEGRHHDWTLYVRSGLERSLPEVCNVDGTRYCIYGDSDYSRR